MALGDGIRCGNPNFGASGLAMTAAGYYFTARHAWGIMSKEALGNKDANGRNEYTVEMAHASPALINIAFSCELAFKSLLSESDRVHIHKLRDLYNKLDIEYQQEIKGRVIGEMNFTDTDFYAKLDECNNNFVDWRYFYEHGHAGIKGHFDVMRLMVEEVLDMYGINYWE
jgi:hypothetical protein